LEKKKKKKKNSFKKKGEDRRVDDWELRGDILVSAQKRGVPLLKKEHVLSKRGEFPVSAARCKGLDRSPHDRRRPTEQYKEACA